jgi:hypothetical protein
MTAALAALAAVFAARHFAPPRDAPGTYRESVTVVADALRHATPGVSSALDLGPALLLGLRGVATDDPIRALQALPGVATGDDFQAEFSVRGAAFRHAGVVLDGVEAPTLLHAVRGADDTGSVAMINTDVLSGATLLAGAHPRRSGDWLGATLEFDVREGSRDRFGIALAASGTASSLVVEGPIGPSRRGSWLVSARKSYLDWLIRRIEPDIDSTIGFADGLAKVVLDVTPAHQVQLLVVGGDAVYRERDASPANGLLRAASGSTLASGTWRATLGRSVLTQRATFFATDFRNRGAVGQQLGRGYTQAAGWQGDVAASLGRGWSIEAGGLVRRERMNQILREFTSVRPGEVRIRTADEVTSRFTRVGSWAQIARTSARGAIAAGARVTRAGSLADTAATPWLLAERRVGRLTWRASVGRSAQFIDPALLGPESATATAERASLVDVGLDVRPRPGLRVAMTLFARRDESLLRRAGEPRVDPVTGRRVPAASFTRFAPVAEATTRGVDVVVARQAGAGPTGWIGYTWAHTRARDVETGETFDGDFDQRHTLNAFVEQRVSARFVIAGKLRVGSNVPIVGYFERTGDGLRLSALRNRVRLPVYARLDLRGSRTFDLGRRRLTLFVEVMNATGRENLRQSEASVRSNLDVVSYAERLVPRVPSAGVVIEF